jgi:hypothetical protein
MTQNSRRRERKVEEINKTVAGTKPNAFLVHALHQCVEGVKNFQTHPLKGGIWWPNSSTHVV